MAIPASIMPVVNVHIQVYAEPGAQGRILVGAKGATPRPNHFNGLWRKACAEVGIKGLHFHDLRHTGNQEREREIADAIDGMIVKALKRGSGRKGHVGGTAS
ncbi:hypothetical protein NMG29_07955 [Streptomyces cocklensis]|uniref:Integrase n=1 Tax=Actinacidiphila cocklensis TaxID=887465 RepID=A0A9W4DN82_9ACTN|nr:hypothetical protein [Actinacidiphila cocklensis]MDD1058159.1 hypothetical protein [Actinacidiphila cocklensis]CAG6393203.1 hypothetical protein SCOCK_20234 [Actinacidiphila cocklensis]